VNLRRFKTTRLVPLLFIEGEPDKTGQIRALLPDAHFTSWVLIASAMRTALAHPPSNPTIPSSGMAAYAGVPLAKKLGLKREGVVALVDAPPGFAKKLEPLPAGAKVVGNATDSAGLTLWFVRSERELRYQIRRMVPLARGGSLWIAWQKKASADAGVSRRHWCEPSPSVLGWWISRSARWMTPGRACASRWLGARPPDELHPKENGKMFLPVPIQGDSLPSLFLSRYRLHRSHLDTGRENLSRAGLRKLFEFG